jgi:RHS repeat-associated protein
LASSDADIYIRDATGNTLAVYHYDRKTSQLRWSEQHLYGSARLGMYLPEKSVTSVSTESKQREVGYLGKQVFELSNHLGNILATITDKKLQVSFNTTSTAYFEADVQTVQDYYAFGMQMPGRKLSGGYRYGFNGKENDNEVKGEGNQQDYGMRIYDGRIGKFLSTDPLSKKYPELSPYQFASNSPIENSDLDGAEAISEIKAGLSRKMEMRVLLFSMRDAQAKVKEHQIRALLHYYATNPNAHAKQSISEAPKEVSDRVRQLRREHFQDPDTGEKTAVGRFFENSHYEKFNSNLVSPMVEAAIADGAGRAFLKAGSAAFKLFEKKTALNAADLARNFQGRGTYGGVDSWRNITLKQGTEIVGGLPGQSNFYTTFSGLERSGLNQEKLWNGLQVEKNISLGYRPSVGIYRVTENTQAAFG